MQSITRHTGTLNITGRLPSSTNGNPRYSFTIDGYSARTSVDSSFAYCLTNYDGRKVTATLVSHYGVLTLNSIEAQNNETR